MAEPPSQPVPPEQTDPAATFRYPEELSFTEGPAPANLAPPTTPTTQTSQTTQKPPTTPATQTATTSRASAELRSSSGAPIAGGMSRGAGLALLAALFFGLGVFSSVAFVRNRD